MAETTRLGDLLNRLTSLDEDATLYAAEPWNDESTALVAIEPPTGDLPEEAARRGLKYFLEVHVAREVLSGWEASLSEPTTARERRDRVIHYAINDA